MKERLRWIWAGLALLALSGCVTDGTPGGGDDQPRAGAELPPLPDWPAEEVEVAKVAVRALIPMTEDTFVHALAHTRKPNFTRDPWMTMSRLEETTLISFQRRLNQQCLLPRGGWPAEVEVDFNDQVRQILSRETGWTGYYAEFPNSAGYVEFSRVGLSEDGRQAMIYVGYQKHWVEGMGKLLLLQDSGLGWKVIDVSHLWGQ